jgi:DNA-binding NtrC family response regulator
MEKKPSILFVEDDEDIRLSFRDYLQDRGYEIYVASDGVGAIKLLIDNQIDIIVTDYRMEILGGKYWIKFLSRFCKDIKVIITTGYANMAISVPFPVINKPFTFDKLEQEILNILK